MESKIVRFMNEIEAIRNGENILPVTCEIDPSSNCCCRCSFCYYSENVGRNKKDMSLRLFLRIALELKSNNVKSITFTGGGEPLMNRHFNEMVRIAKDLGFDIGLITNGVLLDKLKNKDVFKFIRVSLNAGNKEDYLKITGIDYFDKVIQNIKESIYQGAFVGISFVVCKDNFSGIDQAKELANQIGVKYIQFKPVIIEGSIFSGFESIGNNNDEKVIKTNRYFVESYLPCQIAHLIGIITANGDVYYCCQNRYMEQYNLGNINENSFKNIWSKRLKLAHNFENCSFCRYMNYAKKYLEIEELYRLKYKDHKNFL